MLVAKERLLITRADTESVERVNLSGGALGIGRVGQIPRQYRYRFASPCINFEVMCHVSLFEVRCAVNRSTPLLSEFEPL